MEKLNVILYLMNDIKRQATKRFEYMKKHDEWEKNPNRTWADCPDGPPLEPIKQEILMVRRMLNELSKELK